MTHSYDTSNDLLTRLSSVLRHDILCNVGTAYSDCVSCNVSALDKKRRDIINEYRKYTPRVTTIR